MGFSSGEKAGRRPWLPRRSRHFLDPARRASGGTAFLGTPVLAVSLSRQRSLPVLRPSCSAAETPAKAKIGNCFSGTFTATVAVPFPGLGVVSAAITLQTTACLTEQSRSGSAEFQLFASTSTSTPGHASSDIMCQSYGLPENLEQDFPNSRFLFPL